MFKVGQPVWDILHGAGTVIRADETYTYPVRVKFTNGKEATYTLDGRYFEDHAIPALYPYHVEITKKVTKPSINWDYVHSKFKYLAQDADGSAWLYAEKPQINLSSHWSVVLSDHTNAESHATYDPGTCDWKDSLIERPTGNSGDD